MFLLLQGALNSRFLEKHLGKALDPTGLAGDKHQIPAPMNSKQLSLLQHLFSLSSHLFHHKTPQKFSKFLAPSALLCEKAQTPCSVLQDRQSFAAAPVPRPSASTSTLPQAKQETPGFVGCPKGKSHPPGTQQLPMDLIPCIFSFSRAFSSTSRSKAVDPFSSEPPPGS